LASTLQDTADDNDDEANGDRQTATPVVGDDGDERDGADGTDLVESAEEAETVALGLVEVVLPKRDVLVRVEDHTIVIVVSRLLIKVG
jgi:hypothetical protein